MGAHNLTGTTLLQNGVYSKGTAYSEEERAALHLKGLLPPVPATISMQVEAMMEQLRAFDTPFQKVGFRIDVAAQLPLQSRLIAHLQVHGLKRNSEPAAGPETAPGKSERCGGRGKKRAAIETGGMHKRKFLLFAAV